MRTEMILELVGYFASLLVLISLLMSSVVKLRVINMIGSFVFTVYALLIRSYPTAVMNFCLVGVNIFYLVKLAKTERIFTLLPAGPDESFSRYFLRYYRADMESYFPGFEEAVSGADTVFFVYRETEAAGVLIGRRLGDGVLELSLDYSTPSYRDCSVGRFLYQKLAERGIKKLVLRRASEKHVPYLKKMGFAAEEDCYVKQLA